jgi:integrase/recombinase XerC
VRRSAISSFYSFAVSHELLKNNPAEGVARPKSRKPPIRGLNVEEWKALIEAIPNNASGKRDQAIILTMTLTGRRRSEVMGMRVGDLTRNGRVYYNVRVKGGEYVKKELPAPAFQAICDHLKDTGRAIDTLTAEDKLFPVSSAAFYANLKRYAKKANISGVVTPHVFRHTAAKLRQEAGQKLEDISAFLGHADISTTARYLRRIVGEEDAGWRGVYALLGA